VNGYELSTAIKQHAGTLGFADCRIAAIGEASHASFFEGWLAEGRAGEMHYLTRNSEKRRRPSLLAGPGAPPFASMIVLSVDYHQYDLPAEVRDDPSRGIIASYAWGDDYHEAIRPLLYEVDAFVRARTGRTTQGKCLVDTGPVLERDWAQVAGLGFTGKNCCTIVPGQGSWRLLAVILVPEALPPDLSLAQQAQAGGRRGRLGTCGNCTRCLDACPTGAFVSAFDLDPRRCISYWTIEAQGPIPPELRTAFGNRIFGCDICQEVCPYNQRLAVRTPRLAALQAQASRVAPPLLEGFAPEHPYWLDERAFSEHFMRSPLKRAKRSGMLRNVCVALGNWAAADTLGALRMAVGDLQPVVRGHAAWALGRLLVRHPHSAVAAAAARILHGAAAEEADEGVRAEIACALQAGQQDT
jgi:epoxyqueuosine reductase